MVNDYEDGVTYDSIEVLNKEKVYLELAYKNGDIAYREKPGQVIIRIRTKKKEDKK
jgi:hypothetical protein